MLLFLKLIVRLSSIRRAPRLAPQAPRALCASNNNDHIQNEHTKVQNSFVDSIPHVKLLETTNDECHCSIRTRESGKQLKRMSTT